MRKRLFAGERLRALRQRSGLGQAAMATRLGISVSYLSQLENDDRPMTSAVLAALGRHYPRDLDAFEGDEPARRFAATRTALDDPLFADAPIAADMLARLVEQQPHFADRFIALHTAYRRAEERLQMVEETMSSGVAGDTRLPWEEVRDWFHEAGNYVDLLDRRAEALAEAIGPGEPAMIGRLRTAHGIGIDAVPDAMSAPLRALDRRTRRLSLSPALPPESRRFMLAHQLVAFEMEEEIAAIADNAALRSAEARRLLAIGLANYAAGALLMPYERFRAAARSLRHDIDRLGQQFSVSFEQACHRLSTLQRQGARGIPFFFCRVDMAGNITKRHSATRLQFARFGGACPLWIVHEAVAIPDRILVQLAETPDGLRYVQMAKGLVKPSGSYARTPRRYAVALGCEVQHAGDFIYADGLDVAGGATPIGISCRLCPRTDCDQRAFPPADRAIRIDPDRRDVVPYRVT
ncbi:short-chain fatty acyl-CoA regulator family protein [Sphingomonas sp. LaA6.9]|uniref:helix-turn-helix domain-containing protein n=1 Tax=Sphingomonas sp. LaA6.9 TaxID=2919914 RepID=UPI001F4F614C|nr:helix-turn-helix transcriptional regulator [Sphingomonas sp. LaA6.9]MCJ8156961.1 short-chain fatty acyl-CoA regulator family protein [Sphingomonas sp. LaA6.9]